MYASKRRQRNFKRVRDPPKQLTNTNPSKRHRERLNGELETVAMLLPYDSSTISRLDKLSVLRLAVSFLQCKAHFQACLHNSQFLSAGFPMSTHSYSYQPHPPIPFSNKVPTIFDLRIGTPMLDPEESNFEEISLKSLGGFILVLNDNGEIYYASENVENYLGFHQSDVLHQPVYDLIHSEDRDDIRQQLDSNFHIPTSSASNQFDVFAPQNSKYLERNVNARFRCLLDNTCGFLRIDMRGKLMSLHGLPSSYVMGRTASGPVLGMICVCTPFVPPSTSDLASEDMILKTKHQLDGALVSMDQKVYEMLEIDETDLPMPLYNLVHVEDAVCMAEAHKEAIKNGSSGLLVYRLVSTKTRRTYFVQSSCRMFYKNSKPESIGLTHRLLNEVEGTMLLEKRSTLKAKLLSFDDSFLQSPRNLQSTAALPLPSVLKDDQDCLEPSTSNSLFPSVPVPTPTTTKANRRRKENSHEIVPTIPSIPIPTHFDMQMFDPSWNHGVHPPAWPHDVYHLTQYPPTYPHPPGTVGYPDVQIAPVDYPGWHPNDIHMTQLPHGFTPDAQKLVPPHPQMSHFTEYPTPSTHHDLHHHPLKQDNFHLISEVTNLLGT
ncbi:Aryl hydrocarbon receptor protein 1 [Caenorhabditis elegans]|uniref:Aryl hydrocarbon receptor protein 1 n=2 Tax=Caenorhabditis elegans TaxID=6239 RepID=AHR_CAEEL|nr:Aryl hydrocarbon receptor protein 1 [Caenorhabditis elegans]O44712.1 RecName: Full=Aryl hydrocarbon receptor protein 1; Flags: Precursor [Caenorhabditis elegans]AAC00000.1 aryl hydrocarbon receptor ortholog AHR-1 [Caenorhabditis elegans]CAB51463.1 Aryl hydrocarbon receptor protein 1 [Caenorhabditis elegans]|eukprot:NP_001021036.1 Aryl hydrocarbon receptor protein 1 [Caenorhabditis elegans]